MLTSPSVPVQAERALVAAGLKITARAQDLTVEEFASFHRELHTLVLEEVAAEQSAAAMSQDAQAGQGAAAALAAAAAMRDGRADLEDSSNL